MLLVVGSVSILVFLSLSLSLSLFSLFFFILFFFSLLFSLLFSSLLFSSLLSSLFSLSNKPKNTGLACGNPGAWGQLHSYTRYDENGVLITYREDYVSNYSSVISGRGFCFFSFLLFFSLFSVSLSFSLFSFLFFSLSFFFH